MTVKMEAKAQKTRKGEMFIYISSSNFASKHHRLTRSEKDENPHARQKEELISPRGTKKYIRPRNTMMADKIRLKRKTKH